MLLGRSRRVQVCWKEKVGLLRGSRRAIRFPVEARVIYEWTDESGSQHEAEGRILNISEQGALLSAQEHPPQGIDLYLNVFFSNIAPVGVPVPMHGRVVRIEKGEHNEYLGRFAVQSHVMRPEEWRLWELPN
jgi:PilZ domain